MSSFERALMFVLAQEGGYVNDPHDPGGETRYGISKRRYPAEDIRNLTIERARELYRRDYWDQNRCGELPGHMGLAVFDASVNGGAPIRWLQMAVGASIDGVIGPKTIAAAHACRDKPKTVRDMLASRMMYLTALNGWSRYGLGWTRRVVDLALYRMD
jgi:lysozyme family protein